MKKFTFDLQRFAQSWEVNGTTYTSLSAAVNAASAGDTITLKTSKNASGNGFQITKSVIIDLGGYNYQINDGTYTGGSTKAFSTSSDANVTFQNGSITTRGLATAISASGSLTLFNFTTGRNISSSGDITINSTSDSSTGTTTITTGTGNYILDSGVILNTTSGSSMTLTVNGDQTATAVLKSGKTLIASEPSGHEVTYKAIGSAITFAYDDSGTAHVTNLSLGNSFSVSIDNETAVTYTITNGGVQATRDGVMKVIEDQTVTADKSFVIEDWNFDDENTFTQAILTDASNNNNLTISDSISSSLNIGDRLKVIDCNDYSKSFGYLTKTATNTYNLVKESDNNKSLSSINLRGEKVAFDSTFAGATFIANNATFTVKAADNFTVNATTSVPTVSNVNSIALMAGTIQAPQNIYVTAGKRNIIATSGNMTVSLENGKVFIGGLDEGDTFTVDNIDYQMTALGLYDATNELIAISGFKDGTFSVDDAVGGNLVSLNESGNLDLKTTPAAGHASAVTDSTTNPTKIIATINYTSADGYTLTATDEYGFEIQSVSLGSVKTLTTDITATVNTFTSGTFKINGKTFTAQSPLTIAADPYGATLTGGTVSLTDSEVVTPEGTIAATDGIVTVNVNGSAVTIGALDVGDAFTFGGTTYTMTTKGLSNGKTIQKIGKSITTDELGDWTYTTLTLDNSSAAKVTLDSDIEVADASTRTTAIRLVGNALDNSLFGGSGKDTLYGKDGNDYLEGNVGNDKLYGQNGDDTLWGGSGNDTLTGGAGDDLFVYTAGNDFIADYAEGEKISVNAAISASSVKGANATFKIGENTLTVKNGKGAEIVFVEANGNERTIIGGAFVATNSTSAKNTLAAWREVADATARTTAIRIVGNALDNSILGGSGKDSLYGKDGDDYLEGNAGNDKLYGQNGDDTLWGGIGNDTLTGGDGKDVFIYASGEDKDVINGFDNNDMLLITGAFSASYDTAAKMISFTVDSVADAIKIKNFTATTFNVNGLKYRIKGDNFVRK